MYIMGKQGSNIVDTESNEHLYTEKEIEKKIEISNRVYYNNR